MGILTGIKAAVAASVLLAFLGVIGWAKIEQQNKERAQAQLATTLIQLAEARRVAVANEQAARAIEAQCAAGNAATGDAATQAEVLRRALDRARQEIDNATRDDPDVLDRLYDAQRVREPGASQAPDGNPGGAADPARGAGQVPGRAGAAAPAGSP